MNKSNLVELKYLSEASADINVWALAEIVNVAIASNDRRGLTGILFFDQGYFGQILEGRRDAVEETWGKIKNDARHHNIELLGITEIQVRRFPKWSMKLFDAQEFSGAFPQFSELLAQMDDPDMETLRRMRALWHQV